MFLQYRSQQGTNSLIDTKFWSYFSPLCIAQVERISKHYAPREKDLCWHLFRVAQAMARSLAEIARRMIQATTDNKDTVMPYVSREKHSLRGLWNFSNTDTQSRQWKWFWASSFHLPSPQFISRKFILILHPAFHIASPPPPPQEFSFPKCCVRSLFSLFWLYNQATAVSWVSFLKIC